MLSHKNLYNALVAVFFLAFLSSCDKDFNTIGGDIIGDDHFDLLAYRDATLTAYNQRVGVVQSNNLDVNPLGVYNNPVFGKTIAHFVTQLEVSSTNINPTYGENIEVESVELIIPYFSTRTDTNDDGESTYELESIYGTALSKMKLDVYENGYFLRDLDPDSNFTQSQKYFTDQKADFDANIVGNRLNDDEAVSQNDEFFFDPAERVVTTVDEDDEENETVTRSAPAMVLQLNKDFFKTKILSSQGKSNMVNNNLFKNYFRGLYFKIDELGASNTLALLNFKQGKITIKYKEDAVSGEETTRVDKVVELNLLGNTVSLQETTNSPAYENALASSNTSTGDPSLYLKGGPGSMTVIDLFTPEELEDLRAKRWLINDANLTFFIENTTMSSAPEPDRVFLYDLNNKRPLVDFFIDITTNATNPKEGKIIHGGSIQKEATEDGRGVFYRIRITNHIANIIRRDSTNVKLGLVVTDDYRQTTNYSRKNALPEDLLKSVSAGAVMSPLGTVLHGSHPSVPDDKKLRLEIFYTKPN
ncbi:DUF4270 domain-containing protein [Flavobacterium orientale]|uniref:DUF4270 domain-containing protein n=1 Tax=Flavobacterium orientale TaxID=1756020 RepID=A0A917DAS4_9FLAO|nr:DUF4270 domain-containing protein [Flavobacterium orientale]GGD18356.1 hypothetical protein GCM10011343_06240 [Flavobacterium orientale]